MHFTINKDWNHPDSKLHGTDAHWVPGHDLGAGYTRHLVQLAEGDTADNPASTKGPIYGPAFICYDVARSGISVGLYDTPGEFYDDIYNTRKHREAIREQKLDA